MSSSEVKKALHPLHSQFIVELWDKDQAGGYQANKCRRTGRTTAIALKAISDAISEPGRLIPLIDHHRGFEAARHLRHMVDDSVLALELREMNLIDRNGTYFLCFGTEK